MYKATALIPFLDLKEDVQREAGDEFAVDLERAEYLARLNIVSYKEVEEAEEEKTIEDSTQKEESAPKKKKAVKKSVPE